MITSAQKLLMARAGVSAGGEPWSLDGAVYVQSFAVPSGKGGVWFKPDGSKLYTTSAVLGSTGRSVDEFDLSTNWDISTATLNQRLVVGGVERDVNQVRFDPTGTYMFIMGYLQDRVFRYDLTTAWDISTASYVSGSGGPVVGNVYFFFKDDGTVLYHTNQAYPLSTAWLPSSYGTPTTLAENVRFFKDDGLRLYNTTTGINTGTLLQDFALSTAWDVSTATLNSSFDTGNQITYYTANPFISDDGKHLYVTYSSNIYQYKLA